jgi:hypothetical protein
LPLSRARPRPSGIRRRGIEVNQRREPLMSFRSPSEYDRPEPRAASRRRAPLQGPAPFSACGSGKRLSRVCLARVRCAFGVSPPLTLSSSRNLSTVFQIETLLGLRPSKVSPSAAWSVPSGRSCPPGVGSDGSVARTRQSLAHLPGFRLRGSPLPPHRRSDGSGPCLPWAFPPSGVHLPPRRLRSSRNLLPWA